MIFVTVGTHEQPFDRLITCIDQLVAAGVISEKVIMQTGVSQYEPKHCEFSRMLPYDQMVEYVAQARIVITHGGPASFLLPLQMGKIPVVVPRQKRFAEHVNDHQLDFGRQVAQRQKNILLVEDIAQMQEVLTHYEDMVSQFRGDHTSHNAQFCARLQQIVDELTD